MSQKIIPLRNRGRPAFDQVDQSAANRFAEACESIHLSKSSTLSLWRQLAEQLEKIIRSGTLDAHSRIPSEEALANMFQVSRPVIRNALQALAAKGLVVKVHRKGIFIGAPPLETDFITSNLTAYDDMITRGHKVNTRTFEFVRTEPDDQEKEALRLSDGETVIRVGRVFWMDDKPITYTHVSLNGSSLPGFESLDIEDRSILGLIRERYGLKLCRAERWFQAKTPPRQVTDAMGVADGTPMIWIESIAYDPNNVPLEYYRAYYNSETARIHISIMD